MDKIQKFLVTAGRKDLAQQYFNKFAGVEDEIEHATQLKELEDDAGSDIVLRHKFELEELKKKQKKELDEFKKTKQFKASVSPNMESDKDLEFLNETLDNVRAIHANLRIHKFVDEAVEKETNIHINGIATHLKKTELELKDLITIIKTKLGSNLPGIL